MSPIRTVLVQLDATPAAAARLRAALAVADRHAATLGGVFVAEVPQAAEALALADGPAALFERADRAAYEHARELFESARTRSGVALHWHAPGPDGATADLIAEAAYADLLVLGARDARVPEGSPPNLVETVLGASGRPALVLPPAGPALPNPARVVLVGWDGSAAAVHALAAARPWLQAAHRVLVLDGTAQADGADSRILRYLRCHDIAAERVQWPKASQAPGEALLALTRRDAVELLVMGCRGHGWLHEFAGGATGSVLRRLPLPLLMAH